MDERSAYREQVRVALSDADRADESTEEFTDAWLRRLDELMSESRGDGFRPMDQLTGQALRDAAEARGVALENEAIAEIASAVLCPKPFPDAAPGVGALAERFDAVALSNSTPRALAGIARTGGFRWHTALSSELARSYKPDPAVYRLALDLLRIEGTEAMMVAAHPWDLRAAAKEGMRTAYVRRCESDEVADDEFDVQVDSLAALAAELLSSGEN